MKFNRDKIKIPKIATSNLLGKESKLSKGKKIGIISGVTSVVVIGSISVLLLTKPDDVNEYSGEEFNSGNIEEDSWGSLTNPIEESFNQNNLEPLDTGDIVTEEIDGEFEDVTAPLMSSMWYALDGNTNATPKSKTVGSTSTNNYSKIMQKMTSQYQENQKQEQLKAQANTPSKNDTSSTPSTSIGWIGTQPTDGNSGSSNNTGGNSNTSKPPSNVVTTPEPQESISAKLVAYIENPEASTVEDLNKNGVKVIEGSSIRKKLYDSLDSFTDKLIIDTGGDITEKEILKWITDEYPNQLLVTKIDYGFLEKEERFFYLETAYNTKKMNHTEMVNWANKQAKSITASTDQGKIQQVASIIANLGEYKTTGALNIHSPYTLYKKGYGVCQAYTSIGKIMLDALGIRNGIVTGVMNSEAHTWNIAEVDGVETHIDFTLYDTKNFDKKYLNIKEANITSDRIVNSKVF